ncbi:hypothetical protein [Candidatus Coxiella mudrowiae]|uniref:hypothetical protein n=1 Tax=Candidatus Coxiella mudrowiae TaxID=2054173 RepID=UPI00069D592B|nr:hypothetical protein [Candidatus Coxiella mudrowiae]
MTPGRDQLQHSVPEVDGHIEVMKGPFNLILKYLSATRTFAPQDVTFNGVGAFIRAGHMPKLISPRVFMIALFYLDLPMGQTWEALTFNLPKNSYIFSKLVLLFGKIQWWGLNIVMILTAAELCWQEVTGAGLPVCLFACLPVCLFACLPVCLFACLPVPTANIGGA